MAELAASLAPGDDFAAIEMMNSLFDQLVFAGRIFVDNFTVVEYRLDFLGRGFRAECERGQWRASGAASGFFARQERCAERCTGVARDRLNVNIAKAAALLECADQQDILKNSPRETERIGASRFAEVFGK